MIRINQKKVFYVWIAVFLVLPLTAHDLEGEPKTIFDWFDQNPGHELFFKAIQSTMYKDILANTSGPVTLIAPEDSIVPPETRDKIKHLITTNERKILEEILGQHILLNVKLDLQEIKDGPFSFGPLQVEVSRNQYGVTQFDSWMTLRPEPIEFINFRIYVADKYFQEKKE